MKITSIIVGIILLSVSFVSAAPVLDETIHKFPAPPIKANPPIPPMKPVDKPLSKPIIDVNTESDSAMNLAILRS